MSANRILAANVVSRHLAKVGLRPLPSGTSRMREGLRVSKSWQKVRVTADLNSSREAADLAIAAREALIAAGFVIETLPDTPGAFYVTGSPGA
jgi:hypothetical protein